MVPYVDRSGKARDVPRFIVPGRDHATSEARAAHLPPHANLPAPVRGVAVVHDAHVVPQRRGVAQEPQRDREVVAERVVPEGRGDDAARAVEARRLRARFRPPGMLSGPR